MCRSVTRTSGACVKIAEDRGWPGAVGFDREDFINVFKDFLPADKARRCVALSTEGSVSARNGKGGTSRCACVRTDRFRQDHHQQLRAACQLRV